MAPENKKPLPADGPLTVGSAAALPGQTAFGTIFIGTFADGSSLDIPVAVVRGAAPGPVLYVQAACHGIEVNGIEVIRRLMTGGALAGMRGALIAVPVANLVAFNHRMRQTFWDLEDMNRVFPGSAGGGMSQRMAHALYRSAVSKADYLIDLHTGGPGMVTHVRLAMEGKSADLARVFGTEVLVREPLDADFRQMRYDGKLRLVAERKGIVGITPELGAHSSFQEDNIAVGLRGVLNVIRFVGMLDGEMDLPPRQVVVSYSSKTQVKATAGGVLRTEMLPGMSVRAGQELGRTYDIRKAFAEVETFVAPVDGIVMSYNDNPVVHFGDRIASIGVIVEDGPVAVPARWS